MQDLKFNMRTNKASPMLFQACGSGNHLKFAVLTIRKSGAQALEFLQILLSDVIVTSFVSLGTAGGTAGGTDLPMEEIMLNFSAIKFSYKPQNPVGTLDSAVEGSWNVKANTP